MRSFFCAAEDNSPLIFQMGSSNEAATAATELCLPQGKRKAVVFMKGQQVTDITLVR